MNNESENPISSNNDFNKSVNFYTPISAQDAFDSTVKYLENNVQIEHLMGEIMAGIKYMTDRGCFVMISKPYTFLEAERIAVELDKLGYRAATAPGGTGANGMSLSIVQICWKYSDPFVRDKLN